MEHRDILGDFENDETAFTIKDSIPTETDIMKATKRLKNGISAGPSGLKRETIKAWIGKYVSLYEER